MSIIAMLASALGGTAAAGAGATAATAGTAATTAGATAAGSSFLGGLMEKGAAALSTVGDYAGAATDAIGMTDNAGDAKLADLNKQLQILTEEAEAIKAGTEYASEEDRNLDLADNAARSQEVINEIDALTAKQASRGSGLEGTLGGSASAGSMSAPGIVSSGGISAGSFDPNALTGAAMSGLTGTLGGAPKTTQQQLIMAQNQSLGGFRL